MEEIWKDINGYVGYYQVSNFGRVKSLTRIIEGKNGKIQTKHGQIIKHQLNSNTGRPEIKLYKNGKCKLFKVYRLVAEHFVENDDKENKVTVNHLDGDILNCRWDNLEWTTYSENLQHSYDVLKRKPNSAKVKHREVIFIDNNNTKHLYHSIEETSRNTGISCTQIRRIANGLCKSKKGYIFIIPSLSVEDIERVDNN